MTGSTRCRRQDQGEGRQRRGERRGQSAWGWQRRAVTPWWTPSVLSHSAHGRGKAKRLGGLPGNVEVIRGDQQGHPIEDFRVIVKPSVPCAKLVEALPPGGVENPLEVRHELVHLTQDRHSLASAMRTSTTRLPILATVSN